MNRPHRIRRFRRSLLTACVSGLFFGLLGGPLSVGAAHATTPADTESTDTFTGNYLAARQAQRDGNLAAAAEFFSKALKEKPETPGLLRQTFLVTLIEGRVDQAVALAKSLAKEDPNQGVALLTLAVDDLRHKRYRQAAAKLSKMPDEGLATFTKPLLLTWARFGEGKGAASADSLAPLKDHKGVENLVQIHQALIDQLTGKPDNAIKLLTGIIDRQSPASSRVIHLLGAMLERKGDKERAGALYRKYLSEHPTSRLMDAALARVKTGKKPAVTIDTAAKGAAEALYDIGSSLRRENAEDTAVALVRLALYLRPDFPVAQFVLADILESERRDEAAVKEYDGIPESSDYGWSAKVQAATVLGDMKRNGAAETRLKALIRMRPDLADPYLHLGDLYRREEKYDAAAEAYTKAIKLVPKLEPQHWSLFYARGVALERAKRWSESEKDLLKALELRPDQPYVLNYLGYTWIDRGEHLKKATDMIKKAVALAPNDGFIADSLGWAYYRQGEFPQAVTELERAVELRPQDSVINDHLGDAYWKVGRKREARFQWKRSLSLDPEADQIPKLKKKLDSGLNG